jgi:HEAT repeats
MVMIRIGFILLLLTLAGCTQDRTAITTAREYVNGWDAMRANLPADQVPFFAERFTEVDRVLANALKHPNEDIRMRAAYIIKELGPPAATLHPVVVSVLKSEQSRLVRLYLYGALGSMAVSDKETIQLLTEMYDALPRIDKRNSDGFSYSTEDERIYLASALYVLDSDELAKPVYLAEVTQWLAPPSVDLDKSETALYWDHRWCAVNAVEYMKGAKEAIPLLKSMLDERPKKLWVSTYVPSTSSR